MMPYITPLLHGPNLLLGRSSLVIFNSGGFPVSYLFSAFPVSVVLTHMQYFPKCSSKIRRPAWSVLD